MEHLDLGAEVDQLPVTLSYEGRSKTQRSATKPNRMFQSPGRPLAMNNQGVGAEGLLAAQSVLAADGEDFGNDGRVEHLWVLKAIGDCCVHLSI